ncbi:hypothetical protein [Pseudomonas fluorescens]|uniref:hypothetical protein n=1 Tax=Pseudomonas fluorescens TaxID=294 RepID=UPI0028558780|nr:hypothetical protein [Pseudomonas fluorescens]MDR6163455.1 hypothetical protein [Pseudomonas fluorescens]
MVGNHLSGERFDLGQGGLFQRDMCAVVLEQALLGRFFDESIEGVRVAGLGASGPVLQGRLRQVISSRVTSAGSMDGQVHGSNNRSTCTFDEHSG